MEALANACLREIELYNGPRLGVVMDYPNHYGAGLFTKFLDIIFETVGCDRVLAEMTRPIARFESPAIRPGSGPCSARNHSDTVISVSL